MRKNFKKLIAALLALVIMFCAAGCSASPAANNTPGTQDPAGNTVPAGPSQPVASITDLMQGIIAQARAEDPEALKKGGVYAADFALRLYKACYKEGDNTLISPLSVLCALAMTANGADKNTLAEMEKVLGMSKDNLNSFFLSYLTNLATSKNGKLSMANSIWFTDHERFTVNKDFLQTNADYYGAQIFKTRFDGTDAPKNAINDWVKEKTDGMIPEIIDRIPDNIIMYLINALAFDAEWETIYRVDQVHEGQFSCANGQKKTVEFMYGQEGNYLQTAQATGFIKYYKGGDYAFAALLPNEGSSVADVLAGLSGESLQKLLASPQSARVQTAIPKFETRYSTEMSAVLSAMGMPEAFDGNKADLSGIGSSSAGNLFINRVLHKTFISVDEKGTRAGAATAIEIADQAMILDVKRVYLDRPFVYMLIDTTTNMPFFIGVMENM